MNKEEIDWLKDIQSHIRKAKGYLKTHEALQCMEYLSEVDSSINVEIEMHKKLNPKGKKNAKI
jgi:hypothetical protein